jgi:hypothetical protein
MDLTDDTHASGSVGLTNANAQSQFDNFSASFNTPEPASMLLFGSAVGGLALYRRRRSHKTVREGEK